MDESELNAELARLKRLGADHSTVEIKKARGGIPQGLWESIGAFANADGGTILLGVDEASNFDVCGVSDPGAMESQVAAQCAEMEPAVRAEISTVHLDGSAVVVAVIPPVARELRPCHKRSLGAFAGSRLRIADGDRKLTDYEVALLLAARSEPRDDREPVPAASIEDLDSLALATYLRRIRERSQFLSSRPDEEVLRRTNVTVRLPDGLSKSWSSTGMSGRSRLPAWRSIMSAGMVAPTLPLMTKCGCGSGSATLAAAPNGPAPSGHVSLTMHGRCRTQQRRWPC